MNKNCCIVPLKYTDLPLSKDISGGLDKSDNAGLIWYQRIDSNFYGHRFSGENLIDFLRSNGFGSSSGSHSRTNKNYANLYQYDEERLMHGNVSIEIYTDFASTYNWGSNEITEYTRLPAPVAPNQIARPWETIEITTDMVTKTYNVVRTYNYFQLGRGTNYANPGGMPSEPQGLIIDCYNATIPDGQYATMRLFVRQNKLYGSFDSFNEDVPLIYQEKFNNLTYNDYPLGAIVKIITRTGGSNVQEDILFSLKQYLRRWTTSTVDNNCMYSEQMPPIILKLRQDKWYIAFEGEEDIPDIECIPSTATFTGRNITEFDGKVLFFNKFGTFAGFSNFRFNGVILNGSSSFKVRFSVADFDFISTLPLPTCSDFNLNNYVARDSIDNTSSVSVNPNNSLIIEVFCKFNFDTKELTWEASEFVSDDITRENKRIINIRDLFAGGKISQNEGGVPNNNATYNFINNVTSSKLVNFSGEFAPLPGFRNDYILNPPKSNCYGDYDLFVKLGNIDIYRYYDRPDYLFYPYSNQVGTSMSRICHFENAVLFAPTINDDVNSLDLFVHFTPDLILQGLSPLDTLWGSIGIIPTGMTANKFFYNLPNRIRFTYIDETDYQKAPDLKVSLYNGYAKEDFQEKAAIITIPLEKRWAPYKLVLEWDSANPNEWKLVEFTYSSTEPTPTP